MFEGSREDRENARYGGEGRGVLQVSSGSPRVRELELRVGVMAIILGVRKEDGGIILGGGVLEHLHSAAGLKS